MALPRYGHDRDVSAPHHPWHSPQELAKTLCAMRSAPRNGAVALGSMSHRPLEALQKAQQPSTALLCVESMRSLMAWRSLPVAGHARLHHVPMGCSSFIHVESGHDCGVT